jgi:hypothetical protein
MNSVRACGLAVVALVAGCGSDSVDLPEGWAGARPVALTQSECNNSVLPMAPPETVEARTWGPPAEIAYHNAFFRCAQKLCAYRHDFGDVAQILVQPCDMDPDSVAKCSCGYEVGLSVDSSPGAIEVHRRWDNLNRPNPAMLVGRLAR